MNILYLLQIMINIFQYKCEVERKNLIAIPMKNVYFLQ